MLERLHRVLVEDVNDGAQVIIDRIDRKGRLLVMFSGALRVSRHFEGLRGRRAPKVTVTRERDSLRQNRCYPLAHCFCFRVVCLVVSDCELNRARGRLSSLSSRPLAVEYPRPLWGGEFSFEHVQLLVETFWSGSFKNAFRMN